MNGQYRCIWELLADTGSSPSLTVIADSVFMRGNVASNFSSLALPTALGAFTDLSPLGFGAVISGLFGHLSFILP